MAKVIYGHKDPKKHSTQIRLKWKSNKAARALRWLIGALAVSILASGYMIYSTKPVEVKHVFMSLVK